MVAVVAVAVAGLDGNEIGTESAFDVLEHGL